MKNGNNDNDGRNLADDAREFTKCNVASSRIRLARNLDAPGLLRADNNSDMLLTLVDGVVHAADGLFEADLLLMSRLSRPQKTTLIERHIISLPLANNTATGAVLLEREAESVSIMINEEDDIREQCMTDGFSLREAYGKLEKYDANLLKLLPIAYDRQYGFLTACPTNTGTGMRASTMLFLPALKMAGAIEVALREFILRYGLTVRGVYGEGSEAQGDLYQLSNSQMLGISEAAAIGIIERATVEMCVAERRALEKLKREKGSELLGRISRSYVTLLGAGSLGYSELMKLVSDVKLGAILEILPIDNIRNLDKLVWLCTVSSIKLKTGAEDEREINKYRAVIVKTLLKEGL